MTDEPTLDTPTVASRSVPMRTVVLAVALLALVAAVIVAVLQMGRADDADAVIDARRDVTAAASTFGEVYLSYDFDDPERSGDRVLELITPDFAEDFESTRAPAIEELFSNLGTTTAAETQAVYVGDITDETAQVLVVVDVVAKSDASGTQRLTNLTFVLQLVRVDGQWLVDDVVPAPQPDITGDGIEPAPTTTTTTTAP